MRRSGQGDEVLGGCLKSCTTHPAVVIMAVVANVWCGGGGRGG